ncbi:glycosyltransferase family 61 protein [Sulfitobacter sp. JB4-11]|uniref:glycosyltransferase family 61 protein n=1 Tax=Sulfitobacter rhodophyticola TaxID=3238304 RepID=UPI00351804DC
MRDLNNLTAPPEELFLNPYRDFHVQALQKVSAAWHPTGGALIEGFAVSEHPQMCDRINGTIRQMTSHKKFSQPILTASVPVMLEDVTCHKSFIAACGQYLLSGAAGTRMLNRFRWENVDVGAPDVLLNLYFQQMQWQNEGMSLPEYYGGLEPDTPFVVPCRNTFNYYHFLTESLPQLTLLDGLDFKGDIFFHFPNPEEKQRPFARAFAEALFPEFKGRIHFERAPKHYPRAMTAYDLMGGHLHMPPSVQRGIGALLPGDHQDNATLHTINALPMLTANSVPAPLVALRKRALAAIEGGDYGHLPRRIFVGRDTRQSRKRHMAGENLLFEHLQLFGFEYVVFENMPPLEQIAMMAQAEVMVSYHGAGFANMLFANPSTQVIEIGTHQTAQHRWRDFWPVANAAQCKYISFFADYRKENPLIEPNFRSDGLVPASLSDEAVGQIMAFIVTALGHVPTLSKPETLVSLSRQLLAVRAIAQLMALFEAHEEIVQKDGTLCLLRADCHKELDEPRSELVALDHAYKADPSRWQTLVRMIWCANRCERPQVIRWALSQLKADFPERYSAFVGNHEWVRYVA